MKKFLTLGCVLSWTVLLCQPRREIQVGKPFPYEGNKQLCSLLEAERNGRKRTIIIDMFSSTCPSCFKLMPEMQALQDKFKDQVYVILMGKLDKNIERLFEYFRKKFTLTMPVVFDSGYFKQFEYRQLPNYLWLDPEGRVLAETGTEAVNGNMRRLAGGLPLQPQVKVPQDFDPSRLFMVNGNGGRDTSFLFRSVLSLWDGTQSIHFPRKLEFAKNGPFFQVLGATENELYRLAYFGMSTWDRKSEAYTSIYKNPLRNGRLTADTSFVKYCYSFSAKDTGADGQLLKRALQNDLATYFGYKVSVEEMNVPCWKLVALPGTGEKLRSRGKEKFFGGSFTRIIFRCVPISEVLEVMAFADKVSDPVIDATGIDYPIDIVLEAIPYDWDSLVNAFRQNGLDLVKCETKMKVLVLEEN